LINSIKVKTSERIQAIDITDKIYPLVNNIKSGIIFLYVPHTTAGIFINESADPNVAYDIENKLSQLVPFEDNYMHAEGNSDSHIKSTLIKNQTFIFINNSNLVLGTWGGVFFAEFDGPRNRNLYYKILED